ncbi:MAG: hypothetical protein ABI743_15140, partial [bacterium]
MEEIFGMLIPITGIICGCLLAYAGMLKQSRKRELLHAERLHAMELGLDIPVSLDDEDVGRGDPYGNLKAGIILLFLAIAFASAGRALGGEAHSGMQVPALILGFLGFAFLVIHWVIPKAAFKNKDIDGGTSKTPVRPLATVRRPQPPVTSITIAP